MEPRKIERSDNLRRLLEDYLNTKSMSEKVQARMDELKKVLSDATDNQGTSDDKGSMWLPVGDKQLKRERRVSTSFDIDAATAWAKETGLWDELKIVTETLDVDKMLALAWENRELSPLVESFNKEKVTWAFKVVEKKSYDE